MVLGAISVELDFMNWTESIRAYGLSVYSLQALDEFLGEALA